MQTFATTQEAKEFLIGKIIAQAQSEGVTLTDVEKKMLYFSETAWTLPDIDQVSEAFDRDYDQPKYEKKIGALIRNLRVSAPKENGGGLQSWKKAVAKIRNEDHFLLVLIDGADNPPQEASASRFLKLLAIGFALACGIFLVAYLIIRFF